MRANAVSVTVAGGAEPPPQGMREVLVRFRTALISVGLMSGVVNLLYLTGSFFMLQVYDRVIPSRSIPTLLALCVVALGLYLIQAALDFLRSRVLTRLGGALDVDLTRSVFSLVARLPLQTRAGGEGQQPVRDLDALRGFITSTGLMTFFDLPWIPIYIGLCFVFHPYVGWMVLVGAILLGALALMSEFMTRDPVKRTAVLGARRYGLAEAGRRNAEVVRAMGMEPGLASSWTKVNAEYMGEQQRVADIGGSLGAVSKFVRMTLQSAVLALGAYLVIEGQATGGIIIASSILSSRALAPVELAIANWRSFVSARQSAVRLFRTLGAYPVTSPALTLPPPKASLQVEGITVTPPGIPKVLVQDASFALKAGQGLGIIGPSASGKSCLVRTLVGAWSPARGQVRLDGAAYDQWSAEALGQFIGYLPQDVELFGGTITENIARFAPAVDDAAVIAAAQAAGVHDLILQLPDGYGTQIGEGGMALSGGQRQRIGLARALYGDPFMVVLDEPNSNLDHDGEEALTRAMLGVRARGGIVVVVAHKGSALAAVDLVMVMAHGRIQAFGPKDEVLQRVLRPNTAPLTVVAGGETAKANA